MKLTEEQLVRKEIVRTLRKALDLKFANAKARLQNELEPDMLAEYDRRVTEGKPFHLDLKNLLQKALAE